MQLPLLPDMHRCGCHTRSVRTADVPRSQSLLNERTCERHLSSTLPGTPVTTAATTAVSGTAVQDTGHITRELARPEFLCVGKVVFHRAVH